MNETPQLSDEKRTALINKITPFIPYLAKQEDRDKLFYKGGPWDTTDCSYLTCPMQTTVTLQRNGCSLNKITTTLAVLSCCFFGGAPALASCKYAMIGPAALALAVEESRFGDKLLLELASNPNKWPKQQSPSASIEMKEHTD